MSESRFLQYTIPPASQSHAEDCGQGEINDPPGHHDSQSPPRSSSGSRPRSPSPAPEPSAIGNPERAFTPPSHPQPVAPSPAPENSTENPIGNLPEPGCLSPAPEHIDTDGDAIMTDLEVAKNEAPIRKSSRLQQKEHIDTDGDAVMVGLEVEEDQAPIRKSSRLQQKEPQKLPSIASNPRRKPRNQHKGSKASPFFQDGSDLQHAIDVDLFFVCRSQFLDCAHY